MARYIDAVTCAEIISENLNVPLADLVDVFADIPTANVAPKSEVAREIFEEIEHDAFSSNSCFIEILTETFAELKKKYTEDNNDKTDNNP